MTATLTKQYRLILAAFLIACNAQVAYAGTPDWKLDLAKCQLEFSGTQTGAKFTGKFPHFDGTIVFDPDHLDASHITITVDLASAATGDIQRDTAMPGPDWFDIAKFPQAHFDTTSISKTGPNTYLAAGNLTLRGVTKPLSLPFNLQIDGTAAHATGHVSLLRNVFGIGQGPWASGQWVALDVDVYFDITATRAG